MKGLFFVYSFFACTNLDVDWNGRCEIPAGKSASRGEPQADRPLKASAFVSMLEFMDSLKDKFVRMAMVNWKLTPNQKHYSANQLNKLIYEAICSENYSSIKRICKETFLKNRDRIIMSTAF
ncbi:hypothetical protein MZM54_21205 [[Brevibacterium] frigoritolerans]|nr:hypothetical protein [Peribacillus frigoritolerans]